MNKPAINIEKYSTGLFEQIAGIIKTAQKKVAVTLNAETTLLYWSIGNFINSELKNSGKLKYGAEILATLSQQLSWSQLIDLPAIDDTTKQEHIIRHRFADKLQRAMEIVKSNTHTHE